MRICLIGPGEYALDARFGINLPQALWFGVLAVTALLVDTIGIFVSRPAGSVSRTSWRSIQRGKWENRK